MICVAEQDSQQANAQKDQQPDKQQDPKFENSNVPNVDTLNVATKGGKKGDKGQRKGYGQCWECGEYGHPRRECKLFLERMGKGQQQDVAALKGMGKYGKGGKLGKGKGKGYKGKNYYGTKGSKGYRFPGKAIEKGLNYWGEDDYAAAWGNEADYYHNYDDWDYGYGDMNHVGNQMMLLEHNKIPSSSSSSQNNPEQRDEQQNTMQFTVTGKFDPLNKSIHPAPISTQNKYSALEDESDEDAGESGEEDVLDSDNDKRRERQKNYNPNRRQRLQNRRRMAQHNHNNHDDHDKEFEEMHNEDETDEVTRDAAAHDSCTEEDWQTISKHPACKQMVPITTTFTHDELNHNEICNDEVNNNDHWLKPSALAGHHNHWLKDSGHVAPHCANPKSSRGSGVTCKCSPIRGPSSQRRRVNWSDSSGLLAELASHPGVVSNPHEWDPRGEDGREVMPLAKASPVEQLHAPRPLCRIAEGTSFFSVQGRPERLVASEYNDTSPSAWPWDSSGLGVSRRRLNWLLPYPDPQAQLSRCRGQPQLQGCEEDCSANSTSLVVPATHADRLPGGSLGGDAPLRRSPETEKVSQEEQPSACDGYRTDWKTRCHQQTCFHSSARGPGGRGGVEARVSPHACQFRHRPLGVAAPVWQSFSCTPQFDRPESSSTKIALMDVPDGYMVYRTVRDEKAAEGTDWQTSRSTRWSRRARTEEKEVATVEGGECENSTKRMPKSS